jgi:glycogen debranching enzyme
MSERTLSVLDGSTFVVSDRLGDVHADEGREHGFFTADTRFISKWVLVVGPAPLQLLSLDQATHFDVRFFLTPTVGLEDQAPCSVVRRRLVDHVWIEEIVVTNHLHETSRIRVALEIDADFADLFEVKDGVVAPRASTSAADEHALTITYDRPGFHRSVIIASSEPAAVTRDAFAYTLDLDPGAQWSTTLTITPCARQTGARFTPRQIRGTLAELSVRKSAELEAWLAAAPELAAEVPAIARTYRASLSDLAALRIHPDLTDTATLPAAGLPWFMAMFGRDTLITSFQTLPYLPDLAATTLRVLAGRQATERDDFHEREPGKILHELRFGELTALRQRPYSPYYGTADATPLFLVLLDEYHLWTGDEGLVRELEPNARAALDWIADSGDRDGDGYVEYECRNTATGLINQCWKDSWDSIQYADGTLAQSPMATCEIQGYAYDAQRRCARLAREVWQDPVLAERLEARAALLRANFHRDFWMPERGHHAIALDRDKRQVDSLTSNVGQLLWSGLLGEDEAAATVGHLLGEALNSGWGVRTLGSGDAGYNPLGYHTGTVWPHDNSLIVAGLARYGYQNAAITIASAMLGAAPHFEHRLPEVFAGFPRSLTTVPVAFPTASRPQAWSAGAPLLLLSTLLGLAPGDSDVEVVVPGEIGRLALHRRPRATETSRSSERSAA